MFSISLIWKTPPNGWEANDQNFWRDKLSHFYTEVQPQNWNEIYNDTGEENKEKFISVIYNVYQQSFPLVRVPRERWCDKPWPTKVSKN